MTKPPTASACQCRVAKHDASSSLTDGAKHGSQKRGTGKASHGYTPREGFPNIGETASDLGLSSGSAYATRIGRKGSGGRIRRQTMASGAAPKTPLRNRQAKMVATFLATATGREKTANRKMPTLNGYFRPRTSEAGPNAKPRTKREVARTDTSLDMPNSWTRSLLAGLMTDELKATMHTSTARQAVMSTLMDVDKLRGLYCGCRQSAGAADKVRAGCGSRLLGRRAHPSQVQPPHIAPGKADLSRRHSHPSVVCFLDCRRPWHGVDRKLR